MILKCNNLTIGYDNHPIIKDINLEINQGDYVCIFGDNGSGKSTLVKTLLGLTPKLKGDIILGEGLSQKQIGYLPQKNANLADFPASVYEVVRSGCLNSLKWRPFYGKKEIQRTKDMMELLKITNLSTKSFSELSGGQQQRVSIGRAMINNPAIMLADEPTGNLDSKASEEIISLLKLSNKKFNQTVVIITHDLEIAKEAERVITIEDGKIIKDERN